MTLMKHMRLTLDLAVGQVQHPNPSTSGHVCTCHWKHMRLTLDPALSQHDEICSQHDAGPGLGLVPASKPCKAQANLSTHRLDTDETQTLPVPGPWPRLAAKPRKAQPYLFLCALDLDETNGAWRCTWSWVWSSTQRTQPSKT